MNFHIFPLLWDEFLRQLERPMLDWLRGKETFKTLSQIYWQTGWNYWKGNGGGRAWTAQLEAVFFENRHFRTIKQLYDYPKLNALAEQSLQEVSSKKPEERYRQAVKPHLDQRKEELIQTFCDMEKELSLPTPYTLQVGKEALKLEFAARCRRESRHCGMDGYEYVYNGRTYRDVASLCGEPEEELANNVHLKTDVYGEKVLRCYTPIPTFDSGDREWDSREVECLFFDRENIHLVVMRGGYKIARLTFYEKLVAADAGMNPIFEKLGWQLPELRWI